MDSVIVIGAGLGGLEVGYILARHGLRVTVLEQESQIGGCLQTFRRLGRTFDTGFHYVGGLDEGQSLHPLFKYFNLLDLPWKRLDEDCFDEVFIEGAGAFPFASGHERFVERLSEKFPGSREELRKYASFLKGVGDHIFDSFDSPSENFSKSAYEFLCGTVSDPLLRKVLSGTSLKMELNADTLPLYIFAQINNSFIQSAWRLEGGGELIAARLASQIESFGGQVRTRARVERLVEEGGRIARVELEGGETLSADWVVSDAHPAVTLGLVSDTKMLRRIYRNRISSLKNTFGMFTANICLKKDSLPYLNRNVFVHTAGADLWRPDASGTESVLVHSYVPEEGSYSTHLDILSPMSIDSRTEDYEARKEAKARECLSLAEKAIPGLSDAVERVFTSTPLTYESYTGTPGGSAYGVAKDWMNPMGTILSPRTPIPNLLMTGQSLNLHGILGVSMTSVFTSACILGMDALKAEILP